MESSNTEISDSKIEKTKNENTAKFVLKNEHKTEEHVNKCGSVLESSNQKQKEIELEKSNDEKLTDNKKSSEKAIDIIVKTQKKNTTSELKSDIICKKELTKITTLPKLPPNAPLIPVDMLSPPKSESQTDETNTASTSPASEATMSPKLEATETLPLQTSIASMAPTAAATNPRKIDIIAATSKSSSSKTKSSRAPVANGSIQKTGGKPLLSTLNKKLHKPVKKRKQKALVALYESEISHNKVGIKLCIKKSDISSTTFSAATKATAVATSKSRKRSRKRKTQYDYDGDYKIKRKKERSTNNNTEQTGKSKKNSLRRPSAEYEFDTANSCIDQSVWGAKIPEELIYKIFQYVVTKEDCIPTLLRLGKVCSLWRRVSLRPFLWKSMDLSNWVKEKYRTELKLKWFLDNRCSGCTDLNISNWKVTNINCVLEKLVNGCPNLESINLTGWKNFTCDHLAFLVDSLKKLQRLDLSSINSELNASKSAVGLQSLRNALTEINERLTHLYLAHNRLPGIPLIIDCLSTNCPNLVLLDLSNVFTQAASHGVLHVEKLQRGCPKLKVLRVTNSRMSLNVATMQEMMDSPGFPDLEELSVAAYIGEESRVIGDEHLQRILKTSSKLKLLDIRGCMRLTHESLIRLPAWDIKHLFLSGCSITRDFGSRLELIASKWAHSLIELDLAWTNVQQPLDNALSVIAEKGIESPLAHLNLCGSSVSEYAVKDILANCAHMSSINLSSCRGLPRGVKRLMQGSEELRELREVLKVQMKVKLPSKADDDEKKITDENQVTTIANDALNEPKTSAGIKNKIDVDDDGGGGIGGDSKK